MPKVQDALSRVEAAVARLERALLAGGNGFHGGAGTSDQAELAAVADTLARRLDAVIGRLDRALEG